MEKKELIGFISNDIKELELIVKGMQEMKVMQELAISKTQNILDRLYRLEESFQKEEMPAEAEECLSEEEIPEEFELQEEDNIELIEEEVLPEEKKGTVIANEKIKVQERTTNEKFKSRIPSVNTALPTNKRIESRFIQNLRKAINLNDRYRYQRDLFGGNAELMNSVIERLDAMSSLEEAMVYVRGEFTWNTESETVTDFYLLLESRFS